MVRRLVTLAVAALAASAFSIVAAASTSAATNTNVTISSSGCGGSFFCYRPSTVSVPNDSMVTWTDNSSSPRDGRFIEIVGTYAPRSDPSVVKIDSAKALTGTLFTVNGYRGCSHACRYCFARPTHEYLDFHSGADFDTPLWQKDCEGRLGDVSDEPAAFP